MGHHRLWLLTRRLTSQSPRALLPLASVWMKHSRRRGWRVFLPFGFETGLAKGTIMPSDDIKHPVVFIPAQTALAHVGQQQQYFGGQGQPPDPDQQHEENHRRHLSGHPTVCLEDSSDFYSEVTPSIDRFVPSDLEAKPLREHVGARRNDGTWPPWVVEGDPNKTPCEQYVEWFNYIWNNGDPSQWNATVFTNNAVNIDPSGMTTGAEESALNFVMLFRYFPELRGEVVSWGTNETELFINWRFRIPNKVKGRLPVGPITQTLQEQQGGRDFLVPVIDKFCFVDGRVSYRAAYFDIFTLIGHLSNNFSANQLYDYLIAWTWKAFTSGAVPFLIKVFTNLFLGLFVWPPKPRDTGLVAFSGDKVITLRWDRVADAESYRLCRATAIEGPYDPLPLGAPAHEQEHVGTTYTDWNVKDGTPYWYTVSPIHRVRGKGRRAPITDTLKIASARGSQL
jgi:hypothetical protein